MTPDPMTDQQRKQDGHEDPGRPKALRRPDGGRGEQHEQREEREHEQEQEQEQRQEQPFLMLSPTMHAPAANGPGPRGHTHVRSRSLAAPSSAPVMARAHSSPGLDSRGRYVFPQSGPGRPSAVGVTPHELPLRRPSPLRTSFDSVGSGSQPLPSSHSIAISEPILEQPELQASPVSYTSHPSQSAASYTAYSSGGSRAGGGRSVSPSWSPALHNTLPRVSRRRPSSPLLTHAPGQTSNGYTSNGHMSNGGILGSSATTASTPSSASSPSRPSPLILPAKFNEPYPAYSLSLASSMPSTPTSIRSRSPSISSLETIPDIPDAEAAAIEADQIARLKAAADKADAAAEAGGFPHDLKRRSAVDISSSSPGSRFGSGWADKRKRWSVCGAEGRQDLDLETIWED
ncbi:hypothetical protein H112_00401 [Trichophyton rubrum D6]|uniref:Basic proline-rich protein n=3 Tax=Trichophyton TaxID=5550 RepID=F2T0J1_TRIRC|nr:uncharacterized protein TERG_08328 [Trichophyton rubrum CBS 118892]EZF27727.1 hypothetical protein H100_00401 [Trichophyton rubrum MR850]EZF46707.1 hypothetical protein H102_00400 [Trichophyton rubrum CBS 100081]EZF57372.1 hypothetical protein H103_00399 [Trichophyton rubrum CBS 288.86]EZF67948.1 hypothetical protein H104_00400 [Trichophyton rubrum CBS 289.86]EZF78683.1 hypothetical protein H105_00397 [Trichophyton soudanense CBS 452.61]EZF89307.1 hypothetical protein H110_00404 [Trichophy